MAIRFTDQATYRGQINVTLQAASAAFAGTHTVPAGRTGAISSQLQPATAAFAGLFTAAPNRTGAIASTLQPATASITGTFAQAASAVFPLSVSGRQIRDKNASPFLLVGDTPWLLMTGWTDAEVTQYLNDRQARGVNAIICELIEHFYTSTAPNTVTGLAPFSTPNDIRTPNDTYFNRCVSIVQQARSRGMVVLMTPAYYGFNGTQQGWWPQAISTRTTAECQTFGAYVGTKFAGLDNLIMVLGGDYYTAATLTRTQALVTGLKSTGNANWLYTYHADRGNSSADVVNAETWLQLNAIYTDDQTIGLELETGYGVSTVRPMMYFEGYYEGEGASAQELRAQAYMTVLTGGMGGFLGNAPVWTAGFGWQTALNSTGMQDRQRWATFFKAFSWFNLVPDRNDTVLTSGQGTLAAMAYAARMSDGSKIVVYTPSQKALTIALSQLVGASGTAAWYNPSTGVTTSAGTTGVTGTQVFTPPSSGDWVLTISAVQASFTPFSTGKFTAGTVGASANTEYSGFVGSFPIVYSSDFTGPFGESRVARVPLPNTNGDNLYGGLVRTPSKIPTAIGNEVWIRAYVLFPTGMCNGGGTHIEGTNGSIKFWRARFDPNFRLTYLMGHSEGGPGEFLEGVCANTATTPVQAQVNSEIVTQNVFATSFPVLTRGTWFALQWYIKFATNNTGIMRTWVNNTRVINSTSVVTRPTGTGYDVLNDGLALPGDYFNGGPLSNGLTFCYISNIVIATHLSPPTTTDAGGAAYIHPSVSALDF